MEQKKRRCSVCGEGNLIAQVLPEETFQYGAADEDDNVSVTARNVPVEVCDACGESYSGPAAARVEHEAICRALGLLTPEEIRRIRERFGPSQEEFSALTGIGMATVSRWERGRLIQNKAMDRYLRMMASNVGSIRFLKSLQSANGTAQEPLVSDSVPSVEENGPGCGSGPVTAPVNRVFKRIKVESYASMAFCLRN